MDKWLDFSTAEDYSNALKCWNCKCEREYFVEFYANLSWGGEKKKTFQSNFLEGLHKGTHSQEICHWYFKES